MQSFRIIKPAPVLSPYVRHYWILQDDARETVSERTLPVGCVQLVFHKGKQLLSLGESGLQPKTFICGQEIRFSDVMSTGEIEMMTVVFHPHAAKVFLRIPLYLFHGQNISMEDIEDKELSDLSKRIINTPDNHVCICLIEQFLIRRLYDLPEYNLNRISSVLRTINIDPLANISQLSDVACLSSKQFKRIFADHVGVTPKEFIRVVRLQRALFLLQRNANLSFAQLAYECGFSDQSHMIKEFKYFSGYTPAEYLRICAPYSDYFSDF